MSDNDRRWSVALHEAGHAAAAIALGGTVAHASLGDDGSGICHCDASNATDQAFLIAAGPIAQELLADVPQPSAESAIRESKKPAELPVLLEGIDRTIVAARGVVIGQASLSDERQLALWAIQGYESQPERWAERIAFANHIATQIVTDQRAAIIRIATALFHRTAIFEQEIKNAFQGGH